MIRRTIALIAAAAVPLTALAAAFSDVPSSHLYYQQIGALSDRGIIKGNPDGTFKPENTVNRAEMLTMLYRVNGKNPAAPSKTCFKDVKLDAWFAGVVCDAAKNGYVGGYSDGNFRPENAVNRVEALKMIHTVLRLNVDSAASTAPLSAYTDVSLSAWYAPYMANAFQRGILPIAGQEGTKFYPELALKRGEAAAYIFYAMGLKLQTSSSSSSAATRSASSLKEQESVIPLAVDFPFGDDGAFTGKKAKAYAFSLKSATTGTINVTVDPDAGVQCRLYKLDSGTSFSLEYYIGHVIGNKCSMRISLGAGNYQMEVIPSKENSGFTLSSKVVKGDNNDGFREASSLTSSPKTGYLEDEDYAEFYTFKITTKGMHTVDLTGTDALRCIIFPMGDVDLYGFSGPDCNAEYEYPAGTYYVGVMRKDQKEGKESFTIRLR